MIRAFSVSGYRNLVAEDLALSRVNVLIGPNNSGKSSLLAAVRWLWKLAAADGGLYRVFGQDGASLHDWHAQPDLRTLGESSRVQKLDVASIRSELDNGWRLGDLYRSGEPRIGGWPW